MPQPFRVVVVCRANHCRSPLMEFLLRRQAEWRGLDWTVSSAGVDAEGGVPMHRNAARVLRERGFDPATWRSRTEDLAAYADADLVLTATRRERRYVVRAAPQAADHTFTLLQLAHGMSRRPSEEPVPSAELGRWLVARMAWGRDQIQPTPLDERDLADPMHHRLTYFRRCARTIDEAYDQILRSGPRAHVRWADHG